MVPEGEAQPDSPEQLVLLEVQEGQKITCGSVLASVSKITLDLPWRPARAGWQEGREGPRGKVRGEDGGTCHNDKPGRDARKRRWRSEGREG